MICPLSLNDDVSSNMKRKGGLLIFLADHIRSPASPKNNTSAEQTFISASSPKPTSDDVTSSSSSDISSLTSSSSTSAVSPKIDAKLSFKTPAQQQRTEELNERFRPDEPHRPPLEAGQTALHQTILEMTTPHASADDRRRTETLCSIKTLDDLCNELNKRGFQLSRSATYLRLLPTQLFLPAAFDFRKRHVHTVSVVLVRAQNTGRKQHSDTITYLKDLAQLFGPLSIFVLSQDDKARVLLGLPAAKKQAPILIHLEYRVRLPDHDFVIADRHKLISSVYADLAFKNHSISYSGPTFIAIRSGKHDSSTA
ncbi:unnamed protein product [Didymodactylos carnosus]|uniref:Uncharacterized protein n=1 Tax=Didymodactylos carnosus TaxID=1234261 RepID=A0A814G8Q7_9BILA|nr:unnamed protein product [Didymodactylos carnosus]CAF0994525.1 unnamed protein product [Didymodactylos carnosus]CAF3584692.1 unnamed protein product [Didymodactylos carnosus]CAF3766230.1 unnamed protein product [Didymodactylos carnosus]